MVSTQATYVLHGANNLILDRIQLECALFKANVAISYLLQTIKSIYALKTVPLLQSLLTRKMSTILASYQLNALRTRSQKT